MRLRHVAPYLRDTVLRLLPHRAPTGLVRVGSPNRQSPVLLTGNFSLTVRRLRQALTGHDAWLLVADSRGINVWCAAGGGHLTHHDAISVLRTSGIGELVDHRQLILPQLAATGVERGPIQAATGWESRWGPARLEDLPAVLERGGRVRPDERRMRFPLWERLEMATMWFLPMALVGAGVCAALGGWQAAVAAALSIAVAVAGVFAGLPWLRVTGPRRWLGFGLFSLVGSGLGVGLLALLDVAGPSRALVVCLCSLVGMALLSIELAGTTPLYPSSVNVDVQGARIELVAGHCTGAGDCLQVCPREVLRMDGSARKVEIVRPEACILCGACVVQCPEDALRFAFADGRVVEPETVRRTRLNLLGKRKVEVGE